jgi:hypothetical protein
VENRSSIGRFLYTTKGSNGGGPNEYILAQTFNVQDDGTLVIFDAFVRKMKQYRYPKGVVSVHALPEDILPVIRIAKLNSDTFLLAGNDRGSVKFKFYSKEQQRVFKTLSNRQLPQFMSTRAEDLYWYNRTLYYDPNYPSNTLYKVTDQLEVTPVLQLDFGQANFSMDYLLKR